MRFPVYFRRQKGGSGLPALGSDVKPTFANSRLEYAPPNRADNVLSHKLQRPMHRVVIGFWYEGVGTAPASLPVTIYAYDHASEKWFKAATGTLANGELTYLRCPTLADPPQTISNLEGPQNGVEVLVIVDDNTGADGTYHFVAGPDTAFF